MQNGMYGSQKINTFVAKFSMFSIKMIEDVGMSNPKNYMNKEDPLDL